MFVVMIEILWNAGWNADCKNLVLFLCVLVSHSFTSHVPLTFFLQ